MGAQRGRRIRDGIGWFCKKVLEQYQDSKSPAFTIAGNGKQVRDILHAEDMIRLYYTALENVDKVYGSAYNIGGRKEQVLSLLELFAMLEEMLGIKLRYI